MLPLMNEWIDLSNTIPIHGWATNPILTVSSSGAGRGILLSIATPGEEDDQLEVAHFLIDPEIAHAIGYELIGTASNYEVPTTLPDQTVAIEGHSILDDLREDDE